VTKRRLYAWCIGLGIVMMFVIEGLVLTSYLQGETTRRFSESLKFSRRITYTELQETLGGLKAENEALVVVVGRPLKRLCYVRIGSETLLFDANGYIESILHEVIFGSEYSRIKFITLISL
jgi:hypothetical protein